jgi:glucose/arabinose dehydrogenase
MKKHLLAFICLGIFQLGFAQTIQLTQVASGFSSPVDIKHCNDDRLFVVEQSGRIRILPAGSTTALATPFLDISGPVNSGGNEQGLLGLAFSPNYKQDGYFFVNYNTGSGAGGTRISRFSVDPADSNLALVNSEVVLMQFTQPFTNHKGGNMMFGKDGYLYISQGDGGSGGDPGNRAQNKNEYLGKMLRINPMNDSLYTVPATNPFVNDPNAKPEIWAYGLRNAWRCSVDKITGDLWIADVGQDVWEEINFQPANDTGGHNYGWKCYEANVVYSGGCVAPFSSLTFPVFEYAHTTPPSGLGNCSVTGGYVYRGAQFNDLFGKYIFTDYCSGIFWATYPDGSGGFITDSLANLLDAQYGAFGEDQYGELYIAGRGNGRIYSLSETSNCQPVAFLLGQDSISACQPVELKGLAGSGLNYEWYKDGQLLNTGNVPSITASVSGAYQLIVKNGACEDTSAIQVVTINSPSALTSTDTTSIVCITAPAIDLTNKVQPAGGTYSGAGVSGNSFDPAAAGLGNASITYNYTNAGGCSSNYTFSWTVVVCDDINELAGNVYFNVMPNPSNGKFELSVTSDVSRKLQVNVLNNVGQVCYTAPITVTNGGQRIQLDVTGLAQGIYTLQLQSEKGSVVKRIAIN